MRDQISEDVALRHAWWPAIRISFLVAFIFWTTCTALASPDSGWVNFYNGPGNGTDVGYAITADRLHNLYLTGFSYGGATKNDVVTFKFAPDGSQPWGQPARYNGPSGLDDVGVAIEVDTTGSVYTLCVSRGAGTGNDPVLIKYNASGDTIWTRRHNGAANGDDGAGGLALDYEGNSYVTLSVRGLSLFNDILTLKYDANGNLIWSSTYDGPVSGVDSPIGIALDQHGHVFVAGSSDGSNTDDDYLLIKLSTSTGDTLWTRRYDGPHSGSGDADIAIAFCIDSQGNEYVTGQSGASASQVHKVDYATLKYDSSGTLLWVRRYNGTADSTDRPSSIAVSSIGHVIVTGASAGAGSMMDFVTLAYDAVGTPLWERRFSYANLASISLDQATSMSLDSSGAAYVTGLSGRGAGGYDFATIKYSPSGTQVCTHRLLASGLGAWAAEDLLVEAGHTIYVTGGLYRGATGHDIVLMRHGSCDCPCHGDPVCDTVLLDVFDVVKTVEVAFRNGDGDDPLCECEMTDFDCSGATDVFDVVRAVDVAFRGIPYSEIVCENLCGP